MRARSEGPGSWQPSLSWDSSTVPSATTAALPLPAYEPWWDLGVFLSKSTAFAYSPYSHWFLVNRFFYCLPTILRRRQRSACRFLLLLSDERNSRVMSVGCFLRLARIASFHNTYREEAVKGRISRRQCKLDSSWEQLVISQTFYHKLELHSALEFNCKFKIKIALQTKLKIEICLEL